MSTFKYTTTEDAAKAGDIEELKRRHLAGCEWEINC